MTNALSSKIWKRPLVVVGGLPKPIGGVTNFIWRLANLGIVSELIDLYPHHEKSVPGNFSGKIINLKSKMYLIILFLKRYFSGDSRAVFFNFSTARSIYLFFLIIKSKGHFYLMLHHGECELRGFAWMQKIILKKFDLIFCMNSNQKKFYLKHGVRLEKLVFCSSYLPVVLKIPSAEKQKEIDEFFDQAGTLVCSGYPSSLYNHQWCIEYARHRTYLNLAIFIYGSGNEESELKVLEMDNKNVRIFKGFDSNDFNYALSKSIAYLRPTEKDSFGIAVADAVELGIKVLASDVCVRYPGAYLFTPDSYLSFESALTSLMKGEELRRSSAQGYQTFIDAINYKNNNR